MKFKKYFPIFILILAFFIFKLSNLGIRLSDSNIYFYTGYKILHGSVSYRDIFFTNFPLLPYISSIYFLLTAGNLTLYFLTPMIEVPAVAFIIYLIIFKKYEDKLMSFISSALYLFSFIILSTSDHQSGVFIASLFSVLGYYFYLNKKYLISGVFVALMLLTKAYFLPILLSFIVLFLWKKKYKAAVRFGAGAAIIGIIVMLPTLIFGFQDFIKDVFIYSLTRSAGIEKNGIIWFFITHDLPLFILLIFNLIMIKKNKFFGLVSLFGILFIFFYKDVYFLYLNFLIPFLALSYPEFEKIIKEKFGVQKLMLPTFIFGFLIFSFVTYTNGFRNLQKINLDKATEIIKKENPKSLYGVNDVAPALAYLSGVPMLNNIIDTNANIYRKGFLNSKKLTTDAIKQKAIIVAHGAYYPEMGVNEEVTDEIFDKSQIKKSCKLIGSFPVQTEGPENRLNLLKCY